MQSSVPEPGTVQTATDTTETVPPPLRRNWDFQVLWGSQVLSSIGQNISTIALPLLILSLTGSAGEAGLTGTVAAIAGYFGGIIGGPLVDRFDRRTVLICCDGFRCLVAAVMVLLIATHNAPLPVLIVLAALGTLPALPVSSAIQAAIVKVVAPAQLDQAIAQDMARGQAGGLAGNALGGLLFGIAAAIPFAAEAIGLLVSVLGATAIKTSLAVEASPEAGSSDERRPSFFSSIFDGLRWLMARPVMMGICLSVALGNFAFGGLDLVAIVFARHHGASSFQVGLIFAIQAGAGILGAIIATQVIRTFGRLGTTLGFFWIETCIIPLLAFAHSYILIGLLLGLAALLNPASNVIMLGKMMPMIEDEMRGRVLSFIGLLSGGLAALGPIVAGLLLDAIGRGAVIPLALCALATTLTFTLVPALRNFARYPFEAE